MGNAPGKILFAFSDTGGGHRSAAVAIIAALEEMSNGAVCCEMVDMLRTTRFPILRDSPDLYNQLSTDLLPFYNAIYRLTDGAARQDLLTRLVHTWSHHHVATAIRAASPHLIVSTHPLIQRLLCLIRTSHRLPVGVVTVITDLVSLHSSWAYRDVDLYLLPTDEAYQLTQQRGIDPQRMVRSGFPVHPRFARNAHGRDGARQALGLAAEPFTMLITSGGVGAGNIDTLVRELEHVYPAWQFLVVTGKNQALYEALTGEPRNPHTHIYGFVNNMDTLMAASDVVVTKAGPGTLMEALVMRRPVLVTAAVGMQEQGNIDFVLNHQLGFFCPTSERIIDALNTLSDTQCYAETVARLHDAVPRDGARQIAQVLLAQLAARVPGFSADGVQPEV